MSTENIRLVIEAQNRATAELQRIQGDLKRVETQTTQTGRSMQSMGKTAMLSLGTISGALVGVAGANALMNFFSTATTKAAEFERAGLRLEAVLRATGGSAGVTAQQIREFADEMEASTLASAEQVQQSASVLATFRSISGDAFFQTLRLAQDLSEVFGSDLRSATTQLGKALEDPVQGMTALRRVGVSFTAQQRDMIQTMMETGRQAEAQRMILAILTEQVGGSGAGSAGGLAGSLHRAAEGWERLQRGMINNGVAAGAIDAVGGAFNGLAEALENFGRKYDALRAIQRGELRFHEFLFMDRAELEQWSRDFATIEGIERRIQALQSSRGARIYSRDKENIDKQIAELREQRQAIMTRQGLDAARGADLDPFMERESETRRADLLSIRVATDRAREQMARAAEQERREAERRERERLREMVALSPIDQQAFRRDNPLRMVKEVDATAVLSAQFQAEQEMARLKNEQHQRDLQLITEFEQRYLESVVSQTEAKMRSIDQMADAYREAGNDEARVAEWVAAEKLRHARDARSGMIRALRDYADEAGNTARGVETAFRNAFSNLEGAFVDFTTNGRLDFSRMADGIIADITRIIVRASITQPLASSLGGLFGLSFNAQGNAFDASGIIPFARGGVVSAPTIFPFARGIGLMGEAGPEAIMPLRRLPSGDLGVQASGGGGGDMHVTVHNHTPAQVQVRRGRKPDGSRELHLVIADTLAQDIRRGGSMADAIQDTYGLERRPA